MSEDEAPQEKQFQNSLQAIMPPSLADKIKASAIEIVGERREVTVLFLDMANFTATAHALDSEDVYLFTNEAMRLLAEVVYEFEGTIDKFTGDGLMALFGAPVAHENDPERAVRAALEMQATLNPLRERFQRNHGFDLDARIGINTGLVIAGQIGGDLHMEYTVIGDTVNLADRLQAAADPGGVLVSFSTFQRTRPLFKYESLSPFHVKGKPEPIKAFRPLRLRDRPEQVRGLPGLQVPMVGRREALTQLENTLSKVKRQRHSHIALVTGEAGVGKSRLVNEFRRSAAQPDVRLYQGGCMTYARAKPFWLLANVLRDILGLSETDPADTQLEALRAYAGKLQLAVNEVLPYLTNLLGFKSTDPQVEARLRHLDNAILRKMIHNALRQVFVSEATHSTTVLILEDLHWVDPASRDFLEYLIQSIDDVPLMLILVSRDVERESVIQPVVRAAERYHDHLVDIQLTPLSEPEVELLVDQLFQGTVTGAQQLKQRIVERAEGNPFYAEEIVRMLIEGGGLDHQDDGWCVTPRADKLMREVPGTLRGLILARFDQLTPTLRRTLQKMAVLGASFPLELLHRINGVSSEQIATQIRTLQAYQFLIALPSRAHTGYAFRHALIQEVVYKTILKRDRQKLHGQLAVAIEQAGLWLPDERTEALAYHYSESASPAKAIPHLITAAQNALRNCAYEIAIHHYRRAFALLPQPSAADDDRIARIYVGLGQALKLIGSYPEAAEILEDALQHVLSLSMTVDSTSLLPTFIRALRELADIRVRDGDPDEAVSHLYAGLDTLREEDDKTRTPLWRSLIDRLAWVRFRQGHLEEAFRLASSATLGLDSQQTEDPMTLASLYNTLGGVLWQQGNLSEAITYVGRSLELYKSIGYLWGMANAYTNLGVLYYTRGDWSQAALNLEHAAGLQRQTGDLPNRAITLNNLGTLRQSMGDHEAARQDLERSLAIRQRLGDAWGIGHSQIGLAHLAVIQGRFGDAATHVEAALALSDNLGSYEIQAHWLLALIQAEDNLDQAVGSAQHALQMARTADFAEEEADCRRILGLLHGRTGDYLEAEVLLRESVDLCLQLDSPYKKGLALLELGRLYGQMAQADGAQQTEWHHKALTALTEASGQFESLGAVHDLAMAQETLAQIKEDAAFTPPQVASRPPDIDAVIPEGARHTAAILWVKLIPPTHADVEDVFETIALTSSALTTIAQEYKGRVLRRQDGLMVVFGAPVAYEDDAERAVRAAQNMADYVQAQPHPSEVSLTIRLAVSYGDVVAGQIGSELHTEYVIKGEPVQAAQDAAKVAVPGQVWVTEAVRTETRRVFLYHPTPGDPPLWELAGEQRHPAPARGLPGLKARLIGRETPLHAMMALANNLSQQIGGLVWIEGEPGIGKSRLMREFALSLQDATALFWKGGCSPQKSGHAFSLFSALLTDALNLRPTDSPDKIRLKMDRTIQTWPRDAQITRPYMEMLLGLWPSGPYGERLAKLEPEQLRQQTFVALRRLCKSLAAQQPLVILLDDLHWIDPMSAELMQFLLTVVASAPILFICAQRRQGADHPNDRLIRVQSLIPSQTINLRLERLSLPESELLLDELLPGTPLPENLLRKILSHSEGNPYFLEEFVRMLIEQGYLRQNQDVWEIDPDLALGDIPLPSSLETLIRSRIDALPSDLRALMQYVAVIGAPFETDLLEAVSEHPRVKDNLERLESRLLLRRGSEPNQWNFNHTLIEDVVYSAMLKARRKALHLRVADALESKWAESAIDHAEVLAYHFGRADEGTKALAYLMTAGERAAARFANEEAITYFEQAALQLGTLPDTNDHLRWRLAAGLGDVYRSMGKYADSTTALEAGLTLVSATALSGYLAASLYRRLGETAQKQGDLDKAEEHYSQALTLLDQPADEQEETEVAHTMTGLGWTHFLQGRFDQSLQLGKSSLAFARRANALNELALAENLMGGVYYRLGEWAAAMHHTRRAMVLREQMGYTWGVAATLSNLGILAVTTGDWNKARSFFERSLALRQEMGDVEGVAVVHNNLGILACDQGDLDRAESHFRESLAVARPFEMGFHIGNSTIGLARVLLLKNELDAAQTAIDESLAQAEEIGADDLRAEVYCIQSEILLALSALDKARGFAEASAAIAAKGGNRSSKSAAWRVISEIECQRGNFRDAWEALAKAQRALAGAANDLETGRLATHRGHLLVQQERHSEAAVELRKARTIFMRLGATLDLERVTQILKLLSAPKPAPHRL